MTGNVPSMRDLFTVSDVVSRVYDENATIKGPLPTAVVPQLLKKVKPIHEIVPVDVFVPGCPPSADTIYFVISELLQGRIPETIDTRFGA